MCGRDSAAWTKKINRQKKSTNAMRGPELRLRDIVDWKQTIEQVPVRDSSRKAGEKKNEIN